MNGSTRFDLWRSIAINHGLEPNLMSGTPLLITPGQEGRASPHFATGRRAAKPPTTLILLLAMFAAWMGLMAPGRAAEPAPPNIVWILADDLGWGDLGCYGQTRIETPHIDRLAREGMLFSRHYSGSAVCAPSRCVLMTGRHPGHAYVRDNRNRVAGQPGQIPLPEDTVTLPRLLHDIGYATGGFGKWGLGGPETSGAPTHQGLDRFFGYNCQGLAHNFYPTHLWDNDRQVPLDNPAFAAHQRWPAGLDPLAQASYAAYLGRRYAPDVIAEQALQFLDAHASRPFLLFFPSTIPHLALQIPPDELRRFAGRFEETPYTGQRGYLPQRWPRACYAAMVTHLDRHVGQLLEALDRRGLTENTIVIFSSDNGPAVSGTGGVDTDFFGSGGNLRGRKGSLYEGGLRVPLVVRWPGVIPADTRSPAVSGFEDWLPTLLELIGHAERTPSGLDGRSLASTLRGGPPLERELLYREIPSDHGQQALWVGRWKLVRRHLRPVTAGDGPTTELFDLEADPTETNDLAAQHPEVATRLAAILDQQHEPSALFPLTAAEGRPRP